MTQQTPQQEELSKEKTESTVSTVKTSETAEHPSHMNPPERRKNGRECSQERHQPSEGLSPETPARKTPEKPTKKRFSHLLTLLSILVLIDACNNNGRFIQSSSKTIRTACSELNDGHSLWESEAMKKALLETAYEGGKSVKEAARSIVKSSKKMAYFISQQIQHMR